MFFVGGEDPLNAKINMFILDPSNKVIYSKIKKQSGMFLFNATMPGEYSFVFSNMKGKVNCQVTFAFDE